MERKLLVCIMVLTVFFCATSAAFAKTIAAANGTRTAVAAAITAAVDGDTVTIPTDTQTWSTKITVNKKISVIGAGIGKTKVSGQGFLVSDGTDNWRISGMEFTNTSLDNNDAPITVGAQTSNGCRNFRIDNCKFTNYDRPLFIHGHTTGVVDHCSFYGNSGYERSDGIRVRADNSRPWTAATGFGTDDFVFIESCMFDTAGKDSGHCVVVGHGGRCVFRYNTVVEKSGAEFDSAFDNHGYCHGSDVRAGRAFEVYNNTFTRSSGSGWARIINIRGGAGLIFNNTSYEAQDRYDVDIEFSDYRLTKSTAISSSCSPNCKTSRWCPTADGGEGYPCCDQVGRGINNSADPLYLWNNKDHLNAAWAITISSSCTNYIKLNRDYYATAKPGYTPYTYPHPLVQTSSQTTTTAVAAPPRAPTNLKVVPQ